MTTIAVINAYNRFNVMLKNQGGDYQPGQWALCRRARWQASSPGCMPGKAPLAGPRIIEIREPGRSTRNQVMARLLDVRPSCPFRQWPAERA